MTSFFHIILHPPGELKLESWAKVMIRCKSCASFALECSILKCVHDSCEKDQKKPSLPTGPPGYYFASVPRETEWALQIYKYLNQTYLWIIAFEMKHVQKQKTTDLATVWQTVTPVTFDPFIHNRKPEKKCLRWGFFTKLKSLWWKVWNGGETGKVLFCSLADMRLK